MRSRNKVSVGEPAEGSFACYGYTMRKTECDDPQSHALIFFDRKIIINTQWYAEMNHPYVQWGMPWFRL